MKFRALLVLLTLFSFNTGYAQNADEEQPGDPTLESQYRELKDESNNYQIYKVVKETEMDNFWKSVADTLKENHDQIQSLNKEVADLNKQVKNLQSQVSERDASLEEQEFNIEHMSFLGMSLTKSTYVAFTWTIIFILLIIALILFFRFKSANRITVQTRKEFSQLQEEFEAHRKRARETESRIKRELQTEINRVVELKEKLGDK